VVRDRVAEVAHELFDDPAMGGREHQVQPARVDVAVEVPAAVVEHVTDRVEVDRVRAHREHRPDGVTDDLDARRGVDRRTHLRRRLRKLALDRGVPLDPEVPQHRPRRRDRRRGACAGHGG
jgi:hypothetical protein